MTIYNLPFYLSAFASVLLLVGCNATQPTPVNTLVIDAGNFERMPEITFRGVVKDGPLVSVLSPPDGSVYTEDDQIMVNVVFNPSAEGVPADMNTLEVVVKKGWFGKNITADIREHIAGNRLFAESISMAGYTGKFKFEISVDDVTGQRTEQDFEIKITR